MGGHRHRLFNPVRSSHLDSVRTVLIALSPPRAALVLPPCQPLLMAWSPGARGSRLGWHDQQPSGQPGRSRGESKRPRSARVGVGAEQSARREGRLFRRTTPMWVSSMVVGRVCLGVGLPLVVAAFPLPRHEAGSECFAVTDGMTEQTPWPTNSWISAGPVGEGPAVAAYASMASRSSASRRARRCSRWISAARWRISATFGRNVAAAIGSIATYCGVLDRQYAGAINAATICVCDTASNGAVPRGQSSAVSHVNAATGFGRLSPLRWRCPIRRPIRGPHAFRPRAHLP